MCPYFLHIFFRYIIVGCDNDCMTIVRWNHALWRLYFFYRIVK